MTQFDGNETTMTDLKPPLIRFFTAF